MIQINASENEFFCSSADDRELAETRAKKLIEKCSALPSGVNLLISEQPLATSVAELDVERFMGLVPADKYHVVRIIIEIAHLLNVEIRPDNYLVDNIIKELDKLPAFTTFKEEYYQILDVLKKSGLKLKDMPDSTEQTHKMLLELSKKSSIAPEYLIGNFNKVALLCRLFGVRDRTLNISSQYHNYFYGSEDVVLISEISTPVPNLLKRATQLSKNGVRITLFNKGKFNQKMTELSEEKLQELLNEHDENYDVEEGTFAHFISSILHNEEQRLKKTPDLSLNELIKAVKFSSREREAVVFSSASAQMGEPHSWKESELGQALMKMRNNLNWLTVSIGIEAAGDLEQNHKNELLQTQVRNLQKLAGSYVITLSTGQTGVLSERRISEITPEELLFDLYCLAVLEKYQMKEVVKTATAILTLICQLENRDPAIDLDILIKARLNGEPYVSLLGTQGLIMRNTPLINALDALRSLKNKVSLSIETRDNKQVPITEIPIEAFRQSILLMGRCLQSRPEPERILGIINERIVPEITKLPVQVIAKGEHKLEWIVELAMAGIPARYPLRRPWKKLDLGPSVSHGSYLEPGTRNCLGCPVNNLYGLVMKSALGADYEEIITYEATGCFEVYSGIWPYTGKKTPSIHGVFGGVPSEMLGGYAAKRARTRYELKKGVTPSSQKTLHLGWGGDGATFDIGFGNLSGLFSRLQKITKDELEGDLHQRALYVCYDNEGYQNTGNQYSAASAPGGHTTTNPRGEAQTIGNDLCKKPIAEIVTDHGVSFVARLNIHRQEHITRVISRALEDGDKGGFIHFLQPCTTGWKFASDHLTYDLSHLSEEGGLFSPVTFEYGTPYLEIYPTPRNPGKSFLQMQARFRHLLGGGNIAKQNMCLVTEYYQNEWDRNLKLTGFDGEIPQADRFEYLEDEHRMPKISGM